MTLSREAGSDRDETDSGSRAPGGSRGAASAVGRVLPAAYFACVTLLFVWPLVLGRSTSAVPGFQARTWPWRGVVDQGVPAALQVDGAASSFPWSVTYHDALRRFELPFWDWHSFVGGYDLASDGVAGAMYPVHWVLWWAFDPLRAHDLYVALHLWAGGLLTYLLLRHWRLATGPALIGGTAWMLAPFNVGWAQAEMITPVLVVVPLLFWSVSAAIERATGRRVLGASAAIALALVAGNIVVFMVVVWVVGLWAASTWVRAAAVREPAADLRRRAAVLVVIAVGGLALSAYSLLPTMLNLLSLGRRPSSIDEVLPAAQDVGDVAARLWSEPVMGGPGDLFLLSWCGRTVLVLALVGLFHRGGKRTLAAALVVVFTLLPSAPWLVHVAWYVIPPLRGVAGFGRLTFLASFGMALLAAGGTAVLLAGLRRVLARTRTDRHRGPIGVLAVGAVAVLVVVELLPFAVAVNPGWTNTRDAPFFPETPSEAALRGPAESWPGLVLPLTSSTPTQPDGVPYYSFWGSTAHVSGVDSVGGYDSAVPLRAAAMSRIMEGTPVDVAVDRFSTAYLPAFSVQWARLDLAQRVGVTHVYAPPGTDLGDSAYAAVLPDMRLAHSGADGDVWELTDPVRGPRLVRDVLFVDSAEQAFEQLVAPDHDVRSVVVLEATKGDDRTTGRPGPPDGGRIVGSSRGYDEARVDVVLRRASWLVMPIGYADGWRAEVDGRQVDVRPADGSSSAVRVPRGRHTVVFSYRPRGLVVGAALTAAALALGLGLPIVSRLRRQRPTRSRLATANARAREEPLE